MHVAPKYPKYPFAEVVVVVTQIVARYTCHLLHTASVGVQPRAAHYLRVVSAASFCIRGARLRPTVRCDVRCACPNCLAGGILWLFIPAGQTLAAACSAFLHARTVLISLSESWLGPLCASSIPCGDLNVCLGPANACLSVAVRLCCCWCARLTAAMQCCHCVCAGRYKASVLGATPILSMRHAQHTRFSANHEQACPLTVLPEPCCPAALCASVDCQCGGPRIESGRSRCGFPA